MQRSETNNVADPTPQPRAEIATPPAPGAKTSDPDTAGEQLPPVRPNADPVDLAWRFFSSTRLALWLIFGIVVLCIASVVIAQAPEGADPGTLQYSLFVGRARTIYGGFTDVLANLQLFAAASSIWMRLLLALLALNIFVCTLNRWPRVWGAVFRPTVRIGSQPFDASQRLVTLERAVALERAAEPDDRQATSLGDERAALAEFEHELVRRRYRVIVEGPGAAEVARDDTTAVSSAMPQAALVAASSATDAVVYLYADRNAFGRLGTLVEHLALILILVGALASSLLGFRDSELVVPEGSTRPVGHGTGLSVRLDSFADEYYPEGPPKDYRSEVVLLSGTTELRRQIVRVNEPLVYGGIHFHQATFGPAVVIQARDSAGQTVLDDGIALAYSFDSRPLGYVAILDRGLVVYVIGPLVNGQDLRPGQIRVEVVQAGQSIGGAVVDQGQSATIGDLTYTFARERQFSGLQVVSDPGALVIWVGSALLILGMVAVFYFPHRRVHARAELRGDRIVLQVLGPGDGDRGVSEWIAAREEARIGPSVGPAG